MDTYFWRLSAILADDTVVPLTVGGEWFSGTESEAEWAARARAMNIENVDRLVIERPGLRRTVFGWFQ
jgi:hypothetical protein